MHNNICYIVMRKYLYDDLLLLGHEDVRKTGELCCDCGVMGHGMSMD